MKPAVLVTGVALIGAAAFGIWKYAGSGSTASMELLPNDIKLVAEGREIYRENCASCHGARMEGQPNWRSPLPGNAGIPAPPHDETGHTWHHPDKQLILMTLNGGQPYAPKDFQSNMPAFGDVIGERGVIAVLSYIKSKWPKEIQRRHDEINRRAG